MGNDIETRERWMEQAPFSAAKAEKEAFFQQEMERLTEYHRRSCQAYDDICHGLGYGPGGVAVSDQTAPYGAGEPVKNIGPDSIAPYLPVALFKDLELCSVPEEDVIRQVTSSGTTGQQVSRIFLDADTAELQRRALAAITGDFIGGKRMPMLIIDSPDVLRDRRRFSARGSGILGFSMMSSRRFYALDARMQVDWASIDAFLEAAGDGPAFAFGFTFMIWQYLYEALAREGRTIDLKGCCLIHGGGWKKLQDRSVSDETFRRCLRETCGFGEISDYYGMAEQTGSIFMQCAEGHLHASTYSDIEILDPLDFSRCGTGEWGLIALRSWLPGSYPGHMLLTEDRGRILGEDDCPCGRKGKYFEISGRIKKAEIRGCSDTFEAPAAAGTGEGNSTAAAGTGEGNSTAAAGTGEGNSTAAAGTGEGNSMAAAGNGIPAAAGQTAAAAQSSAADCLAGMPDPADGLEILAGQWPPQREPVGAFDPLTLLFLEELSQKFMKEPAYRQYPDIYALGFWLRQAHLRQMEQRQLDIWDEMTFGSGEAAAADETGPEEETGMFPAGEGAPLASFAAYVDWGTERTGRGLVLHIAPSNMPTMFAYSWITALLAGDPSVVRLSGREDPISDTILQGIREVLSKALYEPLRQRNAFVRFPRGHQALEEISMQCAARMIWGGDETVARITAVPKASDAVDIAFPDKYSIAILEENATAAMSDDELRMQAHLFCRDTYGADQNACSSPRSVFWLRREAECEPDDSEGSAAGDKNPDGLVKTGPGAADCDSEKDASCQTPSPDADRTATLSETKKRWWDAVAKEAERYELEAWMATEKYRLLCVNYAKDRRPGPVQTWTNRLYVIPCGDAADWAAAGISQSGEQMPCGSAASDREKQYEVGTLLPEAKLGMFYEFDLNDVTDLYPLLSAKIQTAVCVGADPDTFLQGVREAGCPGVDRAVCAGEALEFDIIWDRKDLVSMLSR